MSHSLESGSEISQSTVQILISQGVWRGKTRKDPSSSQEEEKTMKDSCTQKDWEIHFCLKSPARLKGWGADQRRCKRLGEYRDRVGQEGGGEGVMGRTKRNLWVAEVPIYRRGPSARKVTPLPHSVLYHAHTSSACGTCTTMMCDGADWNIRPVFLGPATDPQYTSAPSTRTWMVGRCSGQGCGERRIAGCC